MTFQFYFQSGKNLLLNVYNNLIRSVSLNKSETILKLLWDYNKKTFELQTRNSTDSFVSFSFQNHVKLLVSRKLIFFSKENSQNEKEVVIDFLATIDLKEKFFGFIIRFNNQSAWNLNIPIIDESIWKIDSATEFSICSDDEGQNSASCLIDKFIIWQTPIQANSDFKKASQDFASKKIKLSILIL